MPQGPRLQHKHARIHSVTVSQHVTLGGCLGLTGATQSRCKRASDEPRISCQGGDALLSTPLIASTPICLMSEKTRTHGDGIHIQYSRCMRCDTHIRRPLAPKCFFLYPSLSHTDKNTDSSLACMHTHTNRIMNPSLTTHTGSAGRIDFNQQD